MFGCQRLTRFPQLQLWQQFTTLKCEVKIGSPRRDNNLSSDESSDCRRRRALKNLSGCKFINGATCSLREVLEWEKSYTAPEADKSMMVLRTFEAFMFARALHLNGDDPFEHTIEFEQITATSIEHTFVGRMQSLVTIYQKVANEVRLCAQYSIPLNWTDLKVAVLSDRAAINALQNVAQYIRGWNSMSIRPSLFHLSSQGSTFDFAREYGLNSTSMNAIYDREKAWEAYLQNKWEKVVKKKKVAEELRADIRREKRNRCSKQRDLDAEQERLNQEFPHHYNHGSRLRTQLRKAIRQIDLTIEQAELTLRQTLTVPAYPVRPFPPSKNDVIQIIFMLNMPRKLEVLGNLCLTAQRALAPIDPTTEMTTSPSLDSTTWTEFCSQSSQSRGFDNSTKMFTVSPRPFAVPSSHGASNVDTLESFSQYAEECIWDPTLNGSAMTWKDKSGKNVNPFEASSTSIIDNFTGKVPRTDQHLQWMNAWPGKRGNKVYANLFLKSEDFEKSSFIALGSLRAFPNQQFRKLMCALLEDNLPWSNSCVNTIVRQSLYQVGELTNETKPKVLWKLDMFQNENGLATFCAVLKSIADKLEQTPRSFECVPLLSELAGFAHQFTNSALPIVKMFAKMARRWAENEKMHVRSPQKIIHLAELLKLARRVAFCTATALLAYKLGPWDDYIVKDICELNVLFRNSFACASVNLSWTEEMIQVESRIAEMMAGRIPELVAYVQKEGSDTVLTGLVHLISETSPGELTWKPFHEFVLDRKQFVSCFEAHDLATDTHYSIKLFTGSVLTDGYTLGGLPANIRKHKRFQELFQRCNFEVFYRNGVLRTESKIDGRLYDFALHSDRDLVIQELATDNAGKIISTVQLCPGKWIERFSRIFPSRVRELCSHWYWVERKCVLFRPKLANDREVFFVATVDESGILECYKVLFSDTKLPYDEILNHLPGYDRFIQRDEPLLSVVCVLNKFEYEQFQHPLPQTVS